MRRLRVDPDLEVEQFSAQHVDHGHVGAGRTGAGRTGDNSAPAQGFSTDQDLDVPGDSRIGRVEDEVFKVA